MESSNLISKASLTEVEKDKLEELLNEFVQAHKKYTA
jgi:hypothetical protein